MAKLASQKNDFPQWYLDTIAAADLADYADVKGCIIFKPYGYALWERIQRDLDDRIKALGVENAYFPLFIPESVINKEKEHIAGFAPECAVVTHGGGKELTEKLYVRPTSETIIYSSMAKWIQSHRDLPMKLNQWANVVRWEMRTRPFLRTLEFLWQEGHTAHATAEETEKMVNDALQMYVDLDRDLLALPVLRGRKPEHEKFAGADYTLTTEAMARDGKAIQAGTSHNLGQGFAKTYGIGYMDTDSQRKHPWTTSWGLSTRIIGTVIVVHGDDKGLRLPPKLAPIQAIIIPIYKTDDERAAVLKAAGELCDTWKAAGIRIKVDDRAEKSPGFKFNQWEAKGVPLRIEIGPKDLEQKQVILARRDTGEKSALPLSECTPAKAQELFAAIQETLYTQAETFLREHTYRTESADEFKEYLKTGGFVWAPWDGKLQTAESIKEKYKATIRLLPETPEDVTGKKDPFSKLDAVTMALYAKAY